MGAVNSFWQGSSLNLDAAYEKQMRVVDSIKAQRDAASELANMQGKTATTGVAMEQQLFATTTGLTPEKAGAVLLSIAEAGDQFKDRFPGAEMAQYQEYIGKLTAVKNIDPEVMGGLAGTVMGFRDFGAVRRPGRGEGRGRDELARKNCAPVRPRCECDRRSRVDPTRRQDVFRQGVHGGLQGR